MGERELDWSDPIIRDGFTQRGYIAAEEGLHPALRFTFRPMIPEDVERVEQAREREPAAEKSRARTGAVIAKQLESWDVKFGDDNAPISEQTVRRMRLSLQTKLYNVITGFRATDIDPQWLKSLDSGVESDVAPLVPESQMLVETVGERLKN